jgi:hypothetical protein
MSIDDGKKSGKGRPQLDSQGFTVRMQRAQIVALDEWRRAQPDIPGRPEAIRRLVEIGLRAPIPSTPNNAARNKDDR